MTEQWTALHGIDAIADGEEVVGDAVRTLYRDDAGVLRVETYLQIAPATNTVTATVGQSSDDAEEYGPGTGDAVNEYVQYEPWATVEFDFALDVEPVTPPEASSAT